MLNTLMKSSQTIAGILQWCIIYVEHGKIVVTVYKFYKGMN